MKITGVRTQLYRYNLTRPIGDANSPKGWATGSHLAVFIDTDADVTGVTLGGGSARRHIHSLAEELLVGKDPRGVRGLWQRMIDRAFKGNNRGVVNEAISTLDVCLWDLKARLNDEPLWKTLGASSRRVRAYASGLDIPLSDDELREFYTRMAGKGIHAGKLKVGLNMADDLRRIGIMRDALATSGKQPELMVDSNEYWSPKQAIRHIRQFEEQFDIFWAEEPARRWDYRGLRQVSEGIRAAVATGENLDHISEFMALVDNRAVDVIEIGRGAGGITGGLQIADLAYAFEIPVSVMNCPGNFAAHFAAALPNHIWMEVLDAGRVAGFTIDTRIEDGWIVLGDSPGSGIVFDEAFMQANAVADPSTADTGLAGGRRQGAALYPVAEGEALWGDE
jgi:L-alanine-DL-glutamate epimerase-like enolase superfamily enzyme